MCVGSHGEGDGTKSLFAGFPLDSGFQPLMELPIALDRQEPAHFRNSVDFLRQQRPYLDGKVRRDQLIPTGWLVQKFLHGELRV